MTDRASFNLVHEPWIRVRRIDENIAVLGLHDVFDQLSEVAELAGETPAQDTAVFRVLMAILLRALRSEGLVDPDDAPEETWRNLYLSDDLSDVVKDYLATHQARFDLLDPVAPFFQVADLATKKGEHSDASVLIPDIGPALFSTRTKDDAESLDLASAARWLVRLQGYDPSGIKSGALGDSRVRGGKGYPIGTGWCGAIGSVLVAGPTLRDTLLLSLPMLALAVGGFRADGDLPPWERVPDTSAARSSDEVQPDGVVDLLTWQQRRVRLFTSSDGTHVTGALIANGDKLARANCFQEPYSAQRFSEIQTKKAGREIWFARTVDPDLTIWRGVQSIFAEAATGRAAAPKGKKTTVPDRIAPVIAQLQSDLGETVEELIGHTPIRLTLTGVAYGTQDAVVESEIFETFPTSLMVLTEQGAPWRRVALSAVDRVLAFRGKFRWFLRQLLISAGASTENYPEEPVSAWMDELQIAFTQWLAQLGHHSSPEHADRQWREVLYRITKRAIDQAIDDAGPRAAIGRILEHDGKDTLHSSGRYQSWVMKQLRDATGARVEPKRELGSESDDSNDQPTTITPKEKPHERS